MKKMFLLLALALTLSSCSGGGAGGAATTEEFSNGGATLETTTTESGGTKTVSVTDASGAEVLSLAVTTTEVTVTAPGQTPSSHTVTFRTPLDAVPTDYTARRMAMFEAGSIALDLSVSPMAMRPDSPGCDWFPDTRCTLDCCADHDACYSANSCGASSWIWFVGSAECKNCNNIAYDCIAAACTGVTETFTDNNCYDSRCNERYDCDPDFSDCTCVDICEERNPTVVIPGTCGDGTCVSGETLENCFTDCGFGSSPSACCAAHSCPDETGGSCGSVCSGGPCCCGAGYACDWHVDPTATQNICVVSDD